MRKSIQFLRQIALTEAVSYLLLLGIAMPLKYVWDQPLAVRVVGMIHGILFVVFCASLAYVAWKAKWPLSRPALVFIASLIPFAPWFVDKRIAVWQQEVR